MRTKKKSLDQKRKEKKAKYNAKTAKSNKAPVTEVKVETGETASQKSRKRKHVSPSKSYKSSYKRAKYANDEKYKQTEITRVTQTYLENSEYREKLKQEAFQKYEQDPAHRAMKKASSINKYTNNPVHKAAVKTYSTHKYMNNPVHKAAVKTSSINKYLNNPAHRAAVKTYSINKYINNSAHRAKVNLYWKVKYAQKTHFRNSILKKVKQKYQNQQWRKLKIQSVKTRYATCKRYQQITNKNAKKTHQRKKRMASDVNVAIDKFKKSVNGPEYVCCSCQRLLFFTQVRELKSLKCSIELVKECITEKHLHKCDSSCNGDCSAKDGSKGKLWLCSTCRNHLNSKQMPVECIGNKLEPEEIPEELAELNTLEQQLISLNIPFMKLISLPIAGEKGVKGPVIVVQSDIEKVTTSLPRPLTDSQIVGVKLKRKLQYKSHADYKMVNVSKIEKAILKLKETNPLYKDINYDETWKDFRGELEWLLEEEPDKVDTEKDPETELSSVSQQENDTLVLTEPKDSYKNDDDDRDELCGIANDSCLAPIDLATDALADMHNRVYSIAPGEKNRPLNILKCENAEAKSFPTLFPTGKNTYDEDRPRKIGKGAYFNSRLMSSDLRFAQNTQYIFFAQYVTELERLLSGVSISMRKGRTMFNGRPLTAQMLDDPNTLDDIMKQDEGFRYMQAVRGSPAYWKKTMSELFAMIRQCGLPTFFVTFSCAELSRWPETIETILRQEGKDVDFETLDFARKCEILRSNPVTAVRMFYNRVTALMRDLIKSPANPIGKVTDSFYRVEFQQRGAPHIHCLFWVKDAPVYGISSKEDIESFVKQYITCSIPDEKTDAELYEIVNSVQKHRKQHSKSCKKGSVECRFNFPKPVSEDTYLVDQKKVEVIDAQEAGSDESVERENVTRNMDVTNAEVSSEKNGNASRKVCRRLFEPDFKPMMTDLRAKQLLKNLSRIQREEEIEQMTTREVLELANFHEEETLCEVMSELAAKPSIVLKRNPNEIWINNYNADLLRAWNANMDIQFILDAYSCIMYILSYISKSEHELGELLKQAKEELSEADNIDLKTQMKKLGFVYFQNREMSVQEAVVRTIGLPLKDCSRQTIFLATDEDPVKMSKPLSYLKQSNMDKDNEDIWMTSLYDRYLARPENDVFSKMCQADFASGYRILSKTEATRAVKNKNPNVSELQNDMGFVMKRTKGKPAVIRYTKHSQTKYPEKYYLTLLKLYLPHRTKVQLKPDGFETYENFYENGAVALSSTEVTTVKEIVTGNQMKFDKNCEELDAAWKDLQRFGALEDAWAQVAPQTEEDRLLALSEKEKDDDHEELVEDDVPDLAGEQCDPKNVTSLCSVELIGDSVRPLLKTMNKKQQEIFYYVRHHCVQRNLNESTKPIYLHISGGAGVGKSHLIKCIYNEASRILRNGQSPTDTTVLLAAPTGTAAFNVGGFTVHSAFKIPRNTKNHYEPLSFETVNGLQASLGNLKLLIIDEVSMVDRRVLSYIHGRLNQIKHIKSTQRDIWFGNVSILALGDFYQLPPVKAKSLMVPDTRQGFDLWHDLFTVCSLDEIMRQKDDAPLAALLNRLRVKSKEDDMCEEDDEILSSRNNLTNVPETALHVFATNKLANNHNEKILTKISTFPRILKAKDYRKDVESRKITECTCRGAADDLLDEIKVDVTARVMLIRNIDVKDGLVNGAFGNVVGFEPEDSNEETKVVYIKFDSEKVGKSLKDKVPKNSPYAGSVPVTVYEEAMSKTIHATRKQFPFKLAWACTIHKTQGMTVNECVFDMRQVFAPGQSYVALSRVTSLKGLYIENYDKSKIFRSDDVHENITKMTPLFENENQPAEKPKLTVLHHNVQGLRSKLPDIKNHSKVMSDVMMFSETLLTSNVPKAMLDLDGYHIYRQERADNTGRGGLVTYTRKDMTVERLNITIPNIESMSLKLLVEGKEIVIVNMYRSPRQSVVDFCESLESLLFNIDISHVAAEKIVAGDLNENLLSDKAKRICEVFYKYGYIQQVQQPTTTSGTLIDVIYTKISNVCRCSVTPTYYSDHEAVKLEVLETNEKNTVGICHVTINNEQNVEKMSSIPSSSISIGEAVVESEVTQACTTESKKDHPVKESYKPSEPSENAYAKRQYRKIAETKKQKMSEKTENNLANTRIETNEKLTSTPKCVTQKRKTEIAHFQTESKQYRKNEIKEKCSQRLSIGNRFSKTGIVNIRQTTCFASCVFQLFFSLESFEPLLNLGTDLSKALKRLDDQMHGQFKKSMNPSAFFRRFDMKKWTGEQQDAHEFLFDIVKALENESPNTLRDVLAGNASDTYKCTTCQIESTVGEMFKFITEQIQNGIIIIEPTEKVHHRPCLNCGSTKMLWTRDIVLSPQALVVQIQRIQHHNDKSYKVHDSVRIQEELVLKNGVKYKLNAVIHHQGESVKEGHYFIKIYDTSCKEWYKCNDERVEKTVFEKTSSTAYLLVYEKE